MLLFFIVFCTDFAHSLDIFVTIAFNGKSDILSFNGHCRRWLKTEQLNKKKHKNSQGQNAKSVSN